MQGRGTLVAMDRDPEMIEIARRRFREKGADSAAIRWVVGSFGDLADHLDRLGIARIDRILLDLGLNTVQLSDPSRGFSFAIAGYLDARYNREEPVPTLAERLARIGVRELEEVLRRYGDERWARRIARAVVRRRERRPIETTTELAAVVRSAVPPAPGRRRIDAATRTFQALRILVNDELEHLARGLEQAIDRLAVGGRIVVISFHSGEDRIVKETFRRYDVRRSKQVAQGAERPRLNVLTRKPIRPTEGERRSNPRSRSARLRAAEKVA